MFALFIDRNIVQHTLQFQSVKDIAAVNCQVEKQICNCSYVFRYFTMRGIQSTPANPDTEGTEENRPDTAESGLAGVKYIESGLKGQKRLSGCRGNPD